MFRRKNPLENLGRLSPASQRYVEEIAEEQRKKHELSSSKDKSVISNMGRSAIGKSTSVEPADETIQLPDGETALSEAIVRIPKSQLARRDLTPHEMISRIAGGSKEELKSSFPHDN